MSKRREFWIDALTRGYTARLISGDSEIHHTVHCVEIRPDERVFSRDEIYSIIGKARNENIKTYEIINELFREGE